MSDNGIDKKEIRREIAQIMIPSVAENILQIGAGVIITAMVGKLMADDVSAQGLSNRIYNCCYALFKGLSVGVTVLIAMHFGRNALDKCRRMAEQSYIIVIPASLALVGLILLFAEPFLRFFSDDALLLAKALSYVRITVWAIPFMSVVCMNTAAFNGRGNTWIPLVIAISMNVVNIAIGQIAIHGIGDFQGIGLTGAAIATLIVQIFGCALGLIVLYNKRGFYRGIKHGEPFFKCDWAKIKSIFTMGLPASAEQLFWQFSAIIMSKIILSYGNVYYAAYLLGIQAEMLSETPAMGFVTTSTTLAGKAMGMRDGNLFRTYYKTLLKMAVVVAIFATLPLFAIPDKLMMLLTDKPDIAEIGTVYVFLMGFAMIPQCVSKAYNGFIRSSGGKRVPMYISFIGIWVIRVPLVFVFGSVLKADIRFIWWIIVLDQVVRFVLSIIYLKRKDVLHSVEREIKREEMLRPLKENAD